MIPPARGRIAGRWPERGDAIRDVWDTLRQRECNWPSSLPLSVGQAAQQLALLDGVVSVHVEPGTIRVFVVSRRGRGRARAGTYRRWVRRATRRRVAVYVDTMPHAVARACVADAMLEGVDG